MDEASVLAAQEQLARAKARCDGAAGSNWVDRDEWDAALDDLLSAERELAAATGQEYARELALDIRWDIGAPLPYLISSRSKAAVVFYLSTNDPGWDGSYVTVVNQYSDTTEPLGVIDFDDVHEIRFGGLNDEAVEGHPLSGKGLAPYAAHEVVNSAWITESERRNSVHSQHRGGWHLRMKHYVLCFHDETLECLASGIRTSRIVASFSDAVSSVSARLLG